MESPTYVSKTYIHKSLNYLYPLLGIDIDAPFKPSVFLWWGREESIETFRIMVFYEKTKSALYERFEKTVLFGNPYYEKKYIAEDGNAYVFDLSSHRETINHFIKGKYSRFAEGVKKRILVFHGCSTDKIPRPGRQIHMSLYPALYYDKVSEEIGVYNLEEVGELLDPPNEKKETFTLNVIEEIKRPPEKPLSLEP